MAILTVTGEIDAESARLLGCGVASGVVHAVVAPGDGLEAILGAAAPRGGSGSRSFA